MRRTSELESKKISSSQSQQHTTGYREREKKIVNRAANSELSWIFLLFVFFYRKGSWQRWLLTTSYSSPPGANDTALRPTASRQFSITSLALLLSQQAEATTMKLQTSLSCKTSTLELQSTLLIISMMEYVRSLLQPFLKLIS